MLKSDVAIIGGGPAGSTIGAFIKKYRPEMDVAIFERERFPRDHVGESHLPAISAILNEMGVWDKVEAADFPIKVGATFKWGSRNDLWHTDFLLAETFQDLPRPNTFQGQRTRTAFQVDRSIYDKILLDHALELGCKVFEETSVKSVVREGDRVTALEVDNGVGSVEARYFVDASGDSGLLRRAMDIPVDAPTALRNIAIYKYWQNAEWAVTLGRGATRIQIMSLGWGWMWFIPITPTRTSVGLVLPAGYYKEAGKSVSEIYEQAIREEPLIAGLLAEATPEPEITATKDWNFIADRLCGENWFLSGDCCGFADPILSAGMTLAHTSARKVAFTIMELERGEVDPAWLKFQYDDGHRAQIRHHMQFADFWYSSNGHFKDLKDYCREIADTAGVNLDPETAFQWLATGGFTIDEPGVAAALTYRVSGLKVLATNMGVAAPEWELTKTNSYKLDLTGVKKDVFARYLEGRVAKIPCLKRGPKILPIVDVFKHLLNALHRNTDSIKILEETVNAMATQDGIGMHDAPLLAIEGIEALLLEGWIKGTVNPDRPFIKVT
ncbi:MAG: tryptophan 7-halogenase [Armatimonadetes bacterium]|nr:tryptophan 7-halogenase [Armatimonadota bacterium]